MEARRTNLTVGYAKTVTPMEHTVYDFTIRVLIYKEDGEFVAHALEMDLLGYGRTENEAMAELTEMIRSQIQFAYQKQDDGLINFPAPKEFFCRWETAHSLALSTRILGDRSGTINLRAAFISFTPDEIRKLIRRGRSSKPEQVCA